MFTMTIDNDATTRLYGQIINTFVDVVSFWTDFKPHGRLIVAVVCAALHIIYWFLAEEYELQNHQRLFDLSIFLLAALSFYFLLPFVRSNLLVKNIVFVVFLKYSFHFKLMIVFSETESYKFRQFKLMYHITIIIFKKFF